MFVQTGTLHYVLNWTERLSNSIKRTTRFTITQHFRIHHYHYWKRTCQHLASNYHHFLIILVPVHNFFRGGQVIIAGVRHANCTKLCTARPYLAKRQRGMPQNAPERASEHLKSPKFPGGALRDREGVHEGHVILLWLSHSTIKWSMSLRIMWQPLHEVQCITKGN